MINNWKMEKRKWKTTSGVTLVELLVYMALVSLFMVVLVQLFTSIFSLQLTTQSTSTLTQDARFIIARMGYDLENAASVSVPGTLGQTSTSLSFVAEDGSARSYSLDGSGNLVETVSGSSANLNGLDTKITNITFERVGTSGQKPTIQVNFTIESTVVEVTGPRTQEIQTTYGLR